MKISLATPIIKFGDFKHNIQEIEIFLKKAQLEKSEIICFPEASISGYSSDEEKLSLLDFSFDYQAELTQLANKYQICCLTGAIEKRNTKFYIAHYVFYPNGKIDFYHKTHLGKREQKVFKAGEKLPVFNYQGFNFAIALCYEIHFPDLARIYAQKGADLIFYPFASPVGLKQRLNIWQKCLPARSYDNQIYTAACNQKGNNGKKEFSGGTIAFDDKGEPVKTVHRQTDEFMAFEYKKNSFSYNFLADRQESVYNKKSDN